MKKILLLLIVAFLSSLNVGLVFADNIALSGVDAEQANVTEAQQQNLLAPPVTEDFSLDGGYNVKMLSLPNTPNQVAGTITNGDRTITFTSTNEEAGVYQIIFIENGSTRVVATCTNGTCTSDDATLTTIAESLYKTKLAPRAAGADVPNSAHLDPMVIVLVILGVLVVVVVAGITLRKKRK